MKTSNKAIYPALDGVAQERFYYSLQDFTLEEEMILEEIVKKFSIPEVVDMNLEFYAALTSYSKIKRELNKKNIPDNIRKELDKQLNLLKQNTVEDIHMRVESLGKKLIISNSISEIEILFNEENRFTTFAFISMQYHRTKKMRLALQDFAKNHRYIKEIYSDPISIIFANNLAWALAYYQKCNIVLLKNETVTPLITGDQPAMNVKHHIKNENGYVGEFELYYPLSPRDALLIQVKEKDKENSVESRNMVIEDVNSFNKLIFDYSEMFAFGTLNCIFPN